YEVQLTVTAGVDAATAFVIVRATDPPVDAPVRYDAPVPRPDAPRPDAEPPCVIEPNAARAVAYQIDPAHTGAQPDGTISLPLRLRWAHDFSYYVPPSYALAANGRVFVVAGGADLEQLYVPAVWALDGRSGKTLWGPI